MAGGFSIPVTCMIRSNMFVSTLKKECFEDVINIYVRYGFYGGYMYEENRILSKIEGVGG